MNIKAGVLLRKDQMDTKDDKKDVQMLKNKIWSRQQTTTKIIMLQGNQIVEETILLEEIQRNSTKKQEVLKELEKRDVQSWKEDRIVYVEERIYIPNNRRI